MKNCIGFLANKEVNQKYNKFQEILKILITINFFLFSQFKKRFFKLKLSTSIKIAITLKNEYLNVFDMVFYTFNDF